MLKYGHGMKPFLPFTCQRQTGRKPTALQRITLIPCYNEVNRTVKNFVTSNHSLQQRATAWLAVVQHRSQCARSQRSPGSTTAEHRWRNRRAGDAADVHASRSICRHAHHFTRPQTAQNERKAVAAARVRFKMVPAICAGDGDEKHHISLASSLLSRVSY